MSGLISGLKPVASICATSVKLNLEAAMMNKVIPLTASLNGGIEVMFNAVLKNACSEMGGMMSAMDSSSRNAGKMLDPLTLTYKSTRQKALGSSRTSLIPAVAAKLTNSIGVWWDTITGLVTTHETTSTNSVAGTQL
ncbi:hypothetical protein YC2023_078029 [Brassica napus]